MLCTRLNSKNLKGDFMLIRVPKENDVQIWKMLWNSNLEFLDQKRAQRVSEGLATDVMAIP